MEQGSGETPTSVPSGRDMGLGRVGSFLAGVALVLASWLSLRRGGPEDLLAHLPLVLIAVVATLKAVMQAGRLRGDRELWAFGPFIAGALVTALIVRVTLGTAL